MRQHTHGPVTWGIVPGGPGARCVRAAISAAPGNHLGAVMALPQAPSSGFDQQFWSAPVIDPEGLIHGVDVVFVPSAWQVGGEYPGLIISALMAERVVLVEPPLGRTADEFRKVIAAARESRGTLIQVLPGIWDRAVETVRRALVNGRAGKKVTSVELQFTVADPGVPLEVQEQVLVHAPQCVAAALRLIEAPGPARPPVKAMAGPNGTSAVLAFKGNRKAIVTWGQAGPWHSDKDPRNPGLPRLEALRVTGDRARIELVPGDDQPDRRLVLSTDRDPEGSPLEPLPADALRPPWQMIVMEAANAVRGAGTAMTLADAGAVTATVDAVLQSMRHRWVRVVNPRG